MLKNRFTLTALIVLSLPAHAALYDQGDGTIYDSILDITWLQDANYAQTNGDDSDGKMSWSVANTWAGDLSYGGFTDWRLASANLINGASPCYAVDGSCDRGYNNTTGEFGHMFYSNLGNIGYYSETEVPNQPGQGLSNTSFIDGESGSLVDFFNIQSGIYWYEEEYAPDTAEGWAFTVGVSSSGYQGRLQKAKVWSESYAWAVRDGCAQGSGAACLPPVPLPGAVWLFGSALLGLLGLQRKHH